jgi:predicted nucleic acid-binding protein
VRLFILDTSVLVDEFRTDRHRERISALSGAVRNSAVVLAELWRGARSKSDQALLKALENKAAVLTPTANNWLESGQILLSMCSDYGFQGPRLRDLHFDVLIALTARSHGATLITSNRSDFEMIHRYRPFSFEVW